MAKNRLLIGIFVGLIVVAGIVLFALFVRTNQDRQVTVTPTITEIVVVTPSITPIPAIVAVDPPENGTVLRGKVMTRDDSPLANVTIAILEDPTIPSVNTHYDGTFDLPVTRLGTMTVTYQLNGYLPAQRSAEAVLNGYALIGDVVLIPPDSVVTTIDLTSSQPMQVAQSSTMTDADGTRRATLLIPQGTTAEMVKRDGSTQALTTLNVRATEYTVGENGPEAMPGMLPPTSGYTYALEYSVDQAITDDAISVQFSQPVFHYVENFLGFPTGTEVPVGYYDQTRGTWIPSENGRVIKIVSIVNDQAQVDSDGDNSPDNALNLSDAERQSLATLFSTGQTLWRVPLTHFSTIDCNFPLQPPTGSIGPDGSAETSQTHEPEPCLVPGSIIECQNQTLGETIPLAGTGLTLNYRSDRVPGRTTGRSLTIRLTPASIPNSVLRVDLEVIIGGRSTTQSFSPAPNLTTTFVWDGNDVYGRPMQGMQRALVRIGYAYRGEYAKPGTSNVQNLGRFADYGYELTGVLSRQEIEIWQVFYANVYDNRVADAFALGGWSLSNHHSYDPAAQILYQGDGQTRDVDLSIGSITETIADGLWVPNSIVVGQDDIVYFTDRRTNQVKRLNTDGIITVIAGNGTYGYSGDGGPATAAMLSAPADVTIDANNNLYIADTQNCRIRRVDASNTITTIAGTGVCGNSGDGGPATAAQIQPPVSIAVTSDGTLYVSFGTSSPCVRRIGTDGLISSLTGPNPRACSGGTASEFAFVSANAIAVGPDGDIYISDTNRNKIYRIGPDGRISIFAGTDTPGASRGDGIPATEARLSQPYGIAVDSLGQVYFAERSTSRVRRIGADGIIVTEAGTGLQGYDGEYQPALRSRLNLPLDVALLSDGRVLVAGGEEATGRIRRIGPPTIRGVSPGEVFFTSEDGSEVYVFDRAGHHLRTLYGLTGAVKYQFSYDSAFRLVTLTDAFNNVVTIERGANGNPTAIVSPFGQRTTLGIDPNGYLSQVTNPNGESYRMISGASGLLTTFTNPRSYASTFTYDGEGRLERDENALDGFIAITRIGDASSYDVELTTAMNRTTTYAVVNQTNGDQERVTTRPSGLNTTTARNADRTYSTTLPDGTTTSYSESPDPRWGMLSPFVGTSSVSTPGGLTANATTTWTATLSDANDPFSLTRLVGLFTFNGRTSRSEYQATTHTWTTTSPGNRSSTVTQNDRGQIVGGQVTGLTAIDYRYDTQGRIEAIVQGARDFNFSYDAAGYVETISDPLNRTITFTYDAAGRVVRQDLAGGRAIQVGYDPSGNVTSITPPGRPDHTLIYNELGLLTTYTPPDVLPGNDATTYQYNLDRDLTLVTRPDGRTIAFDYDDAGRLDILTILRGAFALGYDSTTGNLISLDAPGGVNLAYTYDGFLPLSQTWSGPVSGSVSWAYDTNFRLTSTRINGTNPIVFAYDDDDLLTRAGALTLVRSPQNGLLTGTSIGSVSDTISYNGFGEPEVYAATYNGASLYNVTYTRDDLGRIRERVETIGGVTDTYIYTYDPAGQLVEVKKNGVVVESYSYDLNGNRLTTGITNATYDAQDRQLTFGATTYEYTDNGERRTRISGGQTTTYAYDELGNLLSVTLPDSTRIDYVLDGENRRIGRRVNGTLRRGYLWESSLRIAAELDGSGNVVSRFVYADGINVPEYMIRGGVTYRILTDHLGSVRLVVNSATGNIVQRIDYDAFGKVLQDTNLGFQPFGFAGGLYDSDTGLVRFGARDYDAEIGRWTAKDPIGFAGRSTNLYEYSRLDPVNANDPTGQIAPRWMRTICLALRLYSCETSTTTIKSPPPTPQQQHDSERKKKGDKGNRQGGECAAGPDPDPERSFLEDIGLLSEALALTEELGTTLRGIVQVVEATGPALEGGLVGVGNAVGSFIPVFYIPRELYDPAYRESMTITAVH